MGFSVCHLHSNTASTCSASYTLYGVMSHIHHSQAGVQRIRSRRFKGCISQAVPHTQHLQARGCQGHSRGDCLPSALDVFSVLAPKVSGVHRPMQPGLPVLVLVVVVLVIQQRLSAHHPQYLAKGQALKLPDGRIEGCIDTTISSLSNDSTEALGIVLTHSFPLAARWMHPHTSQLLGSMMALSQAG